MTDLVDETEPCRRCHGDGITSREKTERGTYIDWPCDLCHGTGKQTVRVTKGGDQ